MISKISNESCKYDLIIDGTMNKAKNYLQMIERLRGLGYQIYVIYVRVSKERSLQRVRDQYVQTGRYVPDFVVNEVFQNGEAPFREVCRDADGYMVVDNDNSDAKIVERHGLEIPRSRNYSELSEDSKSLNDEPVDSNFEVVPERVIPQPRSLGEIRQRNFKPVQLSKKFADFFGDLPDDFRMFIWGLPSSGKSSLTLLLADDLSRTAPLLYISGEESIDRGAIAERTRKLGITSNNLYFLETTKLDDIRAALKTGKYKYCIVDSLNVIEAEDTEQGAKIREEFPNVAFIFISHANKDGRAYAGERSLAHLFDVVVHMKSRKARITKNWFGKVSDDGEWFDLNEGTR